MKLFNVKIYNTVPSLTEKGVATKTYLTRHKKVSFAEAKKLRRELGSNASIALHVEYPDEEVAKKVIVGRNKKQYKHHTKSNETVVL